MEQHQHNHNPQIQALVSQYENMSKNGGVGFFEIKSYERLIKYYEETKDWKEAIKVADQALTQHSFSSGLYMKKAQLLLDYGKLDKAMECLDQAANIDPGEVEIYLLKVEALNSLGQYENSIRVLEQAKNLASEDALSDVLLCQAFVYECLEDYVSMFDALKEAIMADAENFAALDRMWLCVELSERYTDSISFHESFLNEHPFSHLAWYNLGHAYDSIQNYPKAAEAYEYAFLINEKFEFAYRDCAGACIKAGMYRKALECYRETLERFKPDADILIHIGICYQSLGNIKKAKHFYRQAAHLEPLNGRVFHHIGRCHLINKKWEKAIQSFEQAIQLNEKCEEFYADLAEAYYQNNQPELAHPCFKRAIEMAPDESKYWIQYATFLMEIHQAGEAMEILDEAMAYSTGQELTFSRIACLMMLGHRQEGLALLSKALKHSPDSYDAMFQLAPALRDDEDVLYTLSLFEHE